MQCSAKKLRLGESPSLKKIGEHFAAQIGRPPKQDRHTHKEKTPVHFCRVLLHYHRIDYLWHTILTFYGTLGGFAGAPQNFRHKMVRHRNSSVGPMQNNSVAHACMVRHRKWCATKIKSVRHRHVKQKIQAFHPFCCINTGIYSFIHKYIEIHVYLTDT